MTEVASASRNPASSDWLGNIAIDSIAQPKATMPTVDTNTTALYFDFTGLCDGWLCL